MFDQLYKAQRACERHLDAPILDERVRYLTYWAVRGSYAETDLEMKPRHWQLVNWRLHLDMSTYLS